MDTGYGRHTVVFEIDVNEDNLLSRLVELDTKASEVSALARKLIRELSQRQQNKG